MQDRLPARRRLGATGQRAEADVFVADGTGKIRLLLEALDAARRGPGVEGKGGYSDLPSFSMPAAGVAEPARIPGSAR